jgi:hypothetical protein
VKYAQGHPLDDKDALAEWMGCDSAAAMDEYHDWTHDCLCRDFGVTSHSLRLAKGETLTPDEQTLAKLEEAAVLHVQRWLAHYAKLGG